MISFLETKMCNTQKNQCQIFFPPKVLDHPLTQRHSSATVAQLHICSPVATGLQKIALLQQKWPVP